MIKKKFFDDVFIVKNKKFIDKRGNIEILDFTRNQKMNQKYNSVITVNKNKGTIRGLHYQRKVPQSKIIKVLNGKIFDVFLNINPRSKNFMKYKYCILDSKNSESLFISKDYAHGYQTITNDTVLVYYINGKMKPALSETIIYNDPQLDIPWPLKCSKISDKDLKGQRISFLEKK